MAKRDPLTFPKHWRRLDTLHHAYKEQDCRSPIGITQGGSSRKYPGAKSAATTGSRRANTPERNPNG